MLRDEQYCQLHLNSLWRGFYKDYIYTLIQSIVKSDHFDNGRLIDSMPADHCINV